MNTHEHILHSAKLNNNCPECYATNGLEISFVQEECENRFYTKAQKSITETMYCNNCNHNIYPVNWTEDIERVYEYHKKQAIPKSSQTNLKPITYGIILFCLAGITALIYFLLN